MMGLFREWRVGVYPIVEDKMCYYKKLVCPVLSFHTNPNNMSRTSVVLHNFISSLLVFWNINN